MHHMRHALQCKLHSGTLVHLLLRQHETLEAIQAAGKVHSRR
jgi:hypothetical protein